MIVKLLYLKKSGTVFPGVRYNTGKIDRNKGELMKVANFGALEAMTSLRPQDYINYLTALAALNSNVRKPQFHAAISGKGRLYDKETLTAVAEKWMNEMGYGDQPYLVIYHKDTDHNHVHLVSCRVDRTGKKIDSAYEKIRSQDAMHKVLGYEYALAYRFSTRAQFFMLLEQAGYPGLDADEKKIAEKIAAYRQNKEEVMKLKALLLANCARHDLLPFLKEQGVELIFHRSAAGRLYGYTIIDHHQRAVYKGSEVLALKELSGSLSIGHLPATGVSAFERGVPESEQQDPLSHVQAIWIADDVDDQQVLGMKRRRQQKARTNTR